MRSRQGMREVDPLPLSLSTQRARRGEEGEKQRGRGNRSEGIAENNLRDLSCLLRCSLRLKALLQNWHLYFFSGASDDFLIEEDDAAVGRTFMLATGISSSLSSACPCPSQIDG
jgi:hypothetical protein